MGKCATGRTAPPPTQGAKKKKRYFGRKKEGFIGCVSHMLDSNIVIKHDEMSHVGRNIDNLMAYGIIGYFPFNQGPKIQA